MRTEDIGHKLRPKNILYTAFFATCQNFNLLNNFCQILFKNYVLKIQY